MKLPVTITVVACLAGASSGIASAEASAQPAAAQVLEISVEEAILMALERNHELAVERSRPEVSATFEKESWADLQPLIFLDEVGPQYVEGQQLRGRGILQSYETDSVVGRAGLKIPFPAGTNLTIEGGTDVADRAPARQLVQSRVGVTVTQPLLQGLGSAVNLARVREARIDWEISEHELRGFTEAFVAQVELAYWDYVLFQREAQILEDAVTIAEQEVRSTEERIRIGTVARVELAAARSEVSLRKQDLIDARRDAEKARLRLIGLLNPPGPAPWDRDIRTKDELVPASEPVEEVAEHVAFALGRRPELSQARLLVDRGNIEIVRTKNGLLPRMDFFARIGSSGYADSFSDSWRNLDGDYPDIQVGLSLEFPVGRNAGRAQYQRATVESRQAEEAYSNLRLMVELDVRTAYVDVQRSREQITAAAQTRELDEEKSRAESEKARLGRASAFQVARAQRDLARSRLAEIAAVVEERKALVELYRMEGSLLQRRGISMHGRASDQTPAD